MTRPLVASRHAGIDETDAVLPTPTDGICVWRYPRQTVTARNGEKDRVRLYSVTHEMSGVGIISGRFRLLSRAQHAARALGDLRYRGRPYDFTVATLDEIPGRDRLRIAALTLGGYRLLGEPYEPAIVEWAERNDVDLDWPAKKVT